MTADTKQILKRALSLSPIERAELIEKLFHSFEFSDRESIDSLWADEAEIEDSPVHLRRSSQPGK